MGKLDKLAHRFSGAAAAALTVFLLASNLYRAATQSVTIDEAHTYVYFASLPASALWWIYTPNHHILHTFLVHFFTLCLPLSEFSLRLASVLGGLLYLTAAYRVCRLLFGKGVWFLAAFGILTLNPFMLDQMSVARGYSLAAGFWLWSVCFALQVLERDSIAPTGLDLAKIGAAVGLSVAANLTFAFIAVAEIFVLLVMLAEAPDFRRTCAWLLGPAVALVGGLVFPIVRFNSEGYAFGAFIVSDTVKSLAAFSYFYDSLKFGAIGIPYDLSQRQEFWFGVIFWCVNAILTAGAVWLVHAWIRAIRGGGFSGLSREVRASALLGATLLIALAGNVAAHFLFKIPYPVSRTALFALAGFPLFCMALAFAVRKPRGLRVVLHGIVLVLAALSIARFIQEFNLKAYAEWRFDASTREVFLRMRDLHAGSGSAAPARVFASIFVAAPLEFYRLATHADWIEQVNEYPMLDMKRLIDNGGFDYVVLTPMDNYAGRTALRVMWSDPATGARILAPSNATSTPSGMVLGAELGPPRRDPLNCVDDTDARILFTGLWARNNTFTEALNSTITYSAEKGAQAALSFQGRRIVYYYTKAFNRGKAEIRIDGVMQGVLDQYSKGVLWRAHAEYDAAAPGSHTFTVKVLGERDPASADTNVDLDCLAVEP